MTKLLNKVHLLSPRRIVLLAGAGLALGAIVVTIYGAAPRPVDIVVLLPDELRARSSRAVLTSADTTVFDAETASAENGRVTFHFWLSPEIHRFEFRVRGCQPLTRSFNPEDVDRLSLRYRCGPEEP